MTDVFRCLKDEVLPRDQLYSVYIRQTGLGSRAGREAVHQLELLYSGMGCLLRQCVPSMGSIHAEATRTSVRDAIIRIST